MTPSEELYEYLTSSMTRISIKRLTIEDGEAPPVINDEEISTPPEGDTIEEATATPVEMENPPEGKTGSALVDEVVDKRKDKGGDTEVRYVYDRRTGTHYKRIVKKKRK